MAISVIQWANGGQFNGTGNTVAIAPTNGNTLIAGMSMNNPVLFTSLKDNNANSFTQDGAGWVTGSGVFNSISWFHLSAVAGVTGATITLSSSAIWGIVICEVSGLAASPVDVMDLTGHNNSGTTAFLAGTITTLNASDLVLGLFNSGQAPTFSASGSWALGSQSNPAGSWATGVTFQVVSTATNWTPAATSSGANSGGGLAASFKAAPSGTTARSRMMMGVGS